MLAFLLLLLAGVVYGSIHAEFHREALARMPLHVMAVHASVRQDNVQRMTLQNTNSTCDAAWNALVDFGNSSICYTWLESLWDLDASVDDIIDDFCAPDPADSNKTCSDKIYDLLVTLVQECQGTDEYTSVKEAVRTIVFATKLPCLRDEWDPSILCFKEFRYLGSAEFLNADIGDGTVNGTNSSTFNQTALDLLCSNCTYKVLEQITLYAPDQFWEFGAYVKIMCTQYSGESCSIQFLGLAENAQSDIDLSDGHIDSICDPCVQTLLYRFSQFSVATFNTTSDFAMSVSFLGSYSIMCQQDPSGHYCLAQLLAFLDARNESYNTTICMDVANGTESCPGTPCQTFWNDLVAELGCCAGAWFDFMQFQFATVPEMYQYPIAPSDLKTLINSGCNVTVPDACEPSQLLLNVTLLNIDPDWVTANEDQFLNLLRDTFVYALAIYPTNFDVSLGQGLMSSGTHLQSTRHRLFANAVDVHVVISTKDQQQTSQVQTNAESLDLTVLFTGLPSQALVDPTQPIEVQQSSLTLLSSGSTSSSSSSSSSSSTSDSTSDSSSTGKENGASALTYSAALLSVLVAALLAHSF